MSRQLQVYLMVAVVFLFVSITGITSAVSLAPVWKEIPIAEGSFFDVMFSADGSTIYAGGNQMFIRSWDGTTRWGGRAGNAATMSTDGNYVVSAAGNLVQVLYRNGTVYWIRGMGAPIRAVAISSNASLIVTADERGDIHSWTGNGESWGLNRSDLVKQIAVSPSGSFIVVTTVTGLKYLSPVMIPVWWDNKSGSLDSFIAISADSSTVITSGENRVSSHTSSGALNWMKDITHQAIIDMACSEDCSTIVLGSQDGNVWALDQQGRILWKYPAGSWVNGVAVSHDGAIIAAGALDGNLYILNHNGHLLAKTKIQSVIQQRSVAMDRDGKRVAVADEFALYGYYILVSPDMTLEETFTPEPRITTMTPIEVTTQSVSTHATKVTKPALTTSTPKSALSPFVVMAAVAGLFLIARKHKGI